jgi:hypothetical protein
MPQMKRLKELSCWSATKTEAGRYGVQGLSQEMALLALSSGLLCAS